MTKTLMTTQLFALTLFFLLFPLSAQDSVTIGSAGGEVGQPADMPVYIRDIPGTLLDADNTVGNVIHQMAVRLSFDASLVDSIQFVKAGVTSVNNPDVFIAIQGDGVVNLAAGYLNVPFPVTLGAAAPGDLIGLLRVVPSSAADGRVIAFSVVNSPGANILGDDTGFLQERIEDGNLTVSVGAVNVGGTGGGLPSVQSFTATPQTIDQGDSSRLAWSVTDADSVSISPTVGTVATSGSFDVSPSQSTVYTLTATNDAGSIQRSVTVNVQTNTQDPPVIDFFNANPTTVVSGNESTLSWSVRNAATVTIDNNIGTVSSTGSRAVAPSNNTTYTLIASNGGGSVSATVTIAVTTARIPVVSSFTVSPTEIVQGDNATLSWNVESAETIDIDQGIGRVSGQGSATVSPDADTVFTLLAQNEFGSVTATASLRVVTAPVISSFSASRDSINVGESVQLTWASEGGNTAVIQPGNLNVNTSGSLTLSPGETTTYRLSVTGDGGTTSAETTVNVEGPASLRLNTDEVPFGDQTSALQVRLSASNAQAFSWQVASKPDWLQTLPEEGEVAAGDSDTVRLLVDRAYLFPGQEMAGTLTLSAAGLANVSVPITLSRPVSKSGEHHLFFPLLEGGSDKMTHLGFTNLNNEAATLDVLIFDQQGGLLEGPNRQTLAGLAGAQIQFDAEPAAWAVATLTVDGVASPLFSGVANVRSVDGEELYTLSPVSDSEPFVYVPHIAQDVNQFYTLGAAVNLSDANQTLRLGAAETNGFTLGAVDPGGQAFFNFAEVMGGTIQGPGWGDITLDGSGTDRVIGAEVFGLVPDTGVRQSVGVGLNQQSAQELYFVHIAGDTSRFWTGIVLINIGDVVTNVTVESYSADGDLVTSQALEFNAGEKRTFLVSAGRFDFGEGAAWLRVVADQPMTGYELFGTLPPGDQFAGFETITNLSNRLAIPHTENGVSAGGWTGVALVNPADQTANIQLRLVAADGTIKATKTETLNPKVKLVQLASNLFDSDIAAGDVILIESSENIAGFVLYGSGSQTMGALVAWPY
ncbi:hypothetical protein [Acanthopleuribacter pedis]|uniref:Uncharacterized protein n=1 Tax=Acanthopleuribacter pedis TaxID=442870 RepID=A0A8J7QI31_9BACT|nr:hypothetical protein [Acanthopleuribacter pedis]MBO1322830.1 hypothetical protein [Acanthopleuribacter pedis]